MRSIALCLTVLCLVLGACGSRPTTAPPAAPTGLTLTDALGRTVTFDAPPQRIVVAGRSSLTIVDTLYLFPGAKERLVGLVVGQQPIGEFARLVDSTWDQKTILAVDAGPEQIAPLRPDVVLLRSFMVDNLGRALAELGIPLIYLDLETPQQYFRDVAVLGQLLGEPARAETIRQYYQARLERIEQAVAGLDAGQRPEVLLVQYSDQGGTVALSVPPTGWLQTLEVELAGGIPIWKEAVQGSGWSIVNFEQIAAWDPEQIFLVSYKTDSAEVVASLKADRQWQALRAVRDGAIHGFPSDIFSWDQPDPRWILGVTWLAGKMHPGLFPDLVMEREVIEFFGQMYGMDEGAIRTHILPRLTGNVE